MRFSDWQSVVVVGLLTIAFCGSSSPRDASAIVVHTTPLYSIGSIENASDYACLTGNQPCIVTSTTAIGKKLFGVGVVRSNGGSCTGTPIGHSTILTAAHCFQRGATAATFSIPGVLSPIDGTPVVRPNFSGNVPDANDVAIVKLKTPLPPWVPIFKLAQFGRIPWGVAATHIGYGCTGTGSVSHTPNGCLPSYQPNVTLNAVEKYPTLVWDCGCLFCGSPIEIEVDCGYYPWGPASEHIWIEDYDATTGALQIPGGRIGQVIYLEGITSFGDSGGPVLYNYHVDQALRPSKYGVYEKLTPDEYLVFGVVSFASDANRNGTYANYSDQAGYAFLRPAIRYWIQQQADEVMPLADSTPAMSVDSPVVASSSVFSNALPNELSTTDTDADADHVVDSVENCPAVPNPSQVDSDADGVGDHCDLVCDAGPATTCTVPEPDFPSLFSVSILLLFGVASRMRRHGPAGI